jgi:hypothetical protein
MRIRITKRPDGAGILRCTRSDGSVTWQKQTSRNAAHFALHDLTHYAVETTLGLKGFFSLLEQGWDMEDTTGKGARGPVPEEAIEVERLVGGFDSERACGTLWTAEEFTEFTRARVLAQADLNRVRSRRAELFRLWRDVPAGGSLELNFPDLHPSVTEVKS